MKPKRKMELRDAIILGIMFLALTLGNKYDVEIPEWANEFFEASDTTMRTGLAATALFLMRVAARNNEIFDKILHLGNVFPEKEIEHSGAEKLIELHVALETGEAISDIEGQLPDSSQLAEEASVGAERLREDDDYIDWATGVLQSLGE